MNGDTIRIKYYDDDNKLSDKEFIKQKLEQLKKLREEGKLPPSTIFGKSSSADTTAPDNNEQVQNKGYSR